MDNSTQEIKKKARGFTLGLILAIVLFLVAVFIFWRITDEIVLEKEGGFDDVAFKMLAGYTNPATTHVMLVFTFFGSTKFLLPAYIVLAGFFLFYKRNRLYSLSVAIIGLGNIGLLFLLKDIFHRHRPLEPLTPNVAGYSYPSGHSFSSFTFFGLLTYIIWKSDISNLWKWVLSVLCISLAVCIATSRVYLHVHFASDVVAGLCLSIIWLYISLGILLRIQRSNKLKN